MITISLTAKRLIFWSGAVCLLIFGIGAFFATGGVLSWFLGVSVGFVATAVRIILLDRSVEKSANMERKNASSYSQLWFLLRFGVAAAALLLCALLQEYFSLIGAALALFSMQFAAYAVRVFNKEEFDTQMIEATSNKK